MHESLKENYLGQINVSLEKINSSSLQLSGAIGLYFDLKTVAYEGTVLYHIAEELSIFSNCLDDVNGKYEKHLNSIDLDEENETYADYEISSDLLMQSRKNLSDFYKEIDEQVQSQIKQIRNEMRKYDY